MKYKIIKTILAAVQIWPHSKIRTEFGALFYIIYNTPIEVMFELTFARKTSPFVNKFFYKHVIKSPKFIIFITIWKSISRSFKLWKGNKSTDKWDDLTIKELRGHRHDDFSYNNLYYYRWTMIVKCMRLSYGLSYKVAMLDDSIELSYDYRSNLSYDSS